MCEISNHKIRAEILSSALLHGNDYNDEFTCGECGEIILIIKNGVHFMPIAESLLKEK